MVRNFSIATNILIIPTRDSEEGVASGEVGFGMCKYYILLSILYIEILQKQNITSLIVLWFISLPRR